MNARFFQIRIVILSGQKNKDKNAGQNTCIFCCLKKFKLLNLIKSINIGFLKDCKTLVKFKFDKNIMDCGTKCKK